MKPRANDFVQAALLAAAYLLPLVLYAQDAPSAAPPTTTPIPSDTPAATPAQPAPASEVVSEAEQPALPLNLQLPESVQKILADYDSQVERMDFDVAPRIQDKKLGVRLRGMLYSWTLSKINPLENRPPWIREHGLRARIEGEINTFDDHQFNISLQPFVRWQGVYKAQEGDWAGDIAANYDIAAGPVSAVQDWQTHWVINTSQEWTGEIDSLTWLPDYARDWSAKWTQTAWIVRTQQYVRKRIQGRPADEDDAKTGYGSSVLVGLQREFPSHLFGQDVRIKASFGPEWRYDHQNGHNLKPRLRVKVVY